LLHRTSCSIWEGEGHGLGTPKFGTEWDVAQILAPLYERHVLFYEYLHSRFFHLLALFYLLHSTAEYNVGIRREVAEPRTAELRSSGQLHLSFCA
jgi:hypothetical protein